MNSSGPTLPAALAAYQDRRHDEAEAICRALAQSTPIDPEVQLLLGLILHKTGRHAESIKWLQPATALLPQSMAAFSALGGAYAATGDFPNAAECFTRCLQLDPLNFKAQYHLGNTLYKQREFERAADVFARAAELEPLNHKAWNNLGNSLKASDRVTEALAAYDRALSINPQSATSHCNRAMVRLMLGQLPGGFREFEWRWNHNDRPKYPQPFWKGEPIRGQTLLLLDEQGFGDAIQFVRYVRRVREAGVRVILEYRPPLQRLLEHSNCADEYSLIGVPPPAFDRQTLLMNLPAIFGTTLETIPDQVPYLAAPPGAELPPPPAPAKMKIGLVWSGNPINGDNFARTIPLGLLAPLLQIPDTVFYSLQLPVPQKDRALFRATPNLVDLAPRLEDFLDTAAVINRLDLVISVDTAVAHLAGALGKPVWTLLQHVPDWRWFPAQSQSPWYPSMRLFRQSQRDQWPPVVARVAAELRQFLANGHA